MISIGIICNTSAAFPLIRWVFQQNWLAGVAVPNHKSDFLDAVILLTSDLGVKLDMIENSNITRYLADWQTRLAANLVLVFGFGHRIRSLALDRPKYGYFNIHFGRLPQYGGEFPVFWQVRRGEAEGVLTVYRMDEGIETGAIAVEIPFEIKADHTFGMVEGSYSRAAVAAVEQLVGKLNDRTLGLHKQAPDISRSSFSIPTQNELLIHWNTMAAHDIVRLAKATNPWNKGAAARINGFYIRIVECKEGGPCQGLAGTILRLAQEGIYVACADNNSVVITIVYSEFGYLDHDHMHLLGLKELDTFDSLN